MGRIDGQSDRAAIVTKSLSERVGCASRNIPCMRLHRCPCGAARPAPMELNTQASRAVVAGAPICSAQLPNLMATDDDPRFIEPPLTAGLAPAPRSTDRTQWTCISPSPDFITTKKAIGSPTSRVVTPSTCATIRPGRFGRGYCRKRRGANISARSWTARCVTRSHADHRRSAEADDAARVWRACGRDVALIPSFPAESPGLRHRLHRQRSSPDCSMNSCTRPRRRASRPGRTRRLCRRR